MFGVKAHHPLLLGHPKRGGTVTNAVYNTSTIFARTGILKGASLAFLQQQKGRTATSDRRMRKKLMSKVMLNGSADIMHRRARDILTLTSTILPSQKRGRCLVCRMQLL